MIRRSLLATALGLFMATATLAQVPQTIVIDGVNDFNAANLIDADSGDTQFTSLDMNNIHLTNDNNFLYFGYNYNRNGWCDINLGLAIDVNTTAGGTTDPFSRKIGWTNIAKRPDFVVYDVVPTQCSSFNFEVIYSWNGSSWVQGTNGSDALGIFDGLFTEGKISLATLGVSAGDTIHVEFWVTQEGTTKGPLDASCSDAVQLSTPSSTTFDTATVIQMTCMHTYVIQSVSDTTPPTVVSSKAVGFTQNAQQQIGLTTTFVDVQFNEPVGAGATTPGNYAITNTAATVTSAVVDGSDASLVHLTLSGAVGPSASFYDVTVTNVQDLAGNPIVNNGVTNKRSFFIKKLRFEGDMSIFLLTNSSPPDSFHVEGSLAPLTFTPKDNARGVHQGSGLYVTQVPLSMSKNPGTGKAEATLEWKWHHQVAGFEPRSNRQHVASSDFGDCDTLFVYWNDDEPSDVISHPIDVCFQVDMSMAGLGAGDTVSVNGDQLPLDFTAPGVILKDDGLGADQTASDGIYSAYVRFPTGTFKTVNYKYSIDAVLECTGQGDRSVFLNDAAFDTVGSAMGPLQLPPRKYDRCTVTDKDIKVILRLDVDYFFGGPVTSVEVGGTQLPLDFGLPTTMLDDGVAPDAAALDDTFTVCVIFPDSTEFNVGYKYLINGNFECFGFPNRNLNLDDTVYSLGNPLIPPVGIWDYCSDVSTDVPGDLPKPRITLHLAQNYPNPFHARTSIRFEAVEPGEAELEIYDVNGRLVKALLRRAVDPGLHLAQWNGDDDQGRQVSPGVYFYRLTLNGERATKRLVVLP